MVNEYGLSSDDTGDERIGRLRDEVGRLREELSRRERENDRQKRQIDGLRRQDERQKREIEHLSRQLAAARRAGFRQAAPFAKDRPQGRGRRPGRRAGAQYGRKACVSTLEAPVPRVCPDCGGSVAVTQGEVRPVVRRFDIEVGHCSRCQRRVQGRHALRPRMRWARPVRNWAPASWRWSSSCTPRWAYRWQRSPTCCGPRPAGDAGRPRSPAAPHSPRAAPTYTALCEQVRNLVTPDETGSGGCHQPPVGVRYPGDDGLPFAPAAGSTATTARETTGCSCGRVGAYRCYRAALHQSCCSDDARNCGRSSRQSLGRAGASLADGPCRA